MRTRPSGSAVARCQNRGWCRSPTTRNCRLTGSNTSARPNVPMPSMPPATSTVPSGSTVAVCEKRASCISSGATSPTPSVGDGSGDWASVVADIVATSSAAHVALNGTIIEIIVVLPAAKQPLLSPMVQGCVGHVDGQTARDPRPAKVRRRRSGWGGTCSPRRRARRSRARSRARCARCGR